MALSPEVSLYSSLGSQFNSVILNYFIGWKLYSFSGTQPGGLKCLCVTYASKRFGVFADCILRGEPVLKKKKLSDKKGMW